MTKMFFQGDKVKLVYGVTGVIETFEGNVAVIKLDNGGEDRAHVRDLKPAD